MSDPNPEMPSYPLQRHAGKVGYGPSYNAGASLADRFTGLYDEAKGHLTHNPELIHHGHELFAGELKRKELLGETGNDPVFEKGQNSAKETSAASGTQPNINEPNASGVNKSRKESKSVGSGVASSKPPKVGDPVKHVKGA